MKQATKHLIWNMAIKRKSYVEYKRMKKDDIFKVLVIMFNNYDMLRKRYIDLKVENDYYHRLYKLRNIPKKR